MDPEWEELEAKGASKQRCLWASTGVKNPDYKDTVYVEELVGPDTVNTMPRELVEAVLDHGDIRGDTLLENAEEASRDPRCRSSPRASPTTTSCRRSSARASRSSRSPSRT